MPGSMMIPARKRKYYQDSGNKNAEKGSRKQRNDTIFKHRSNFALLEVNIEETSLKFVLKNKKGKGISYFVVLSRWIFFKTTTVVQYLLELSEPGYLMIWDPCGGIAIAMEP